MPHPLPFNEVAERNLADTLFAPFVAGHIPFPPDFAAVGDTIAVFCFYLGYADQGRAASYAHSLYREREAREIIYEFGQLYSLFRAGLYRSLAGRFDEAAPLWEQGIERLRRADHQALLKQRKANLLINEAYALARLGRFAEVAAPARRGFDAIKRGYGIDATPYLNTGEYGLAPLLEALAAYQLAPTEQGRQATQHALLHYKQQNVRHGRLGYGTIFDLQHAYPAILAPVLPGDDPAHD